MAQIYYLYLPAIHYEFFKKQLPISKELQQLLTKYDIRADASASALDALDKYIYSGKWDFFNLNFDKDFCRDYYYFLYKNKQMKFSTEHQNALEEFKKIKFLPNQYIIIKLN